jgi:hypothetical protein
MMGAEIMGAEKTTASIRDSSKSEIQSGKRNQKDD